MKVIVLGSSGLIGSSVYDMLRSSGFSDTIGFSRASRISSDIQFPVNGYTDLNNLKSIILEISPDVVVNCCGVTKCLVDRSNMAEVLVVNSHLPLMLASISHTVGIRTIHVSTDCVFLGSRGRYTEKDHPDAVDLYGVSKALGEVEGIDNFCTLRTSVIGFERKSEKHGLLEWFLSQRVSCPGYTNAYFSGVTSYQLAREVLKLIDMDSWPYGLYNFSNDRVDKFTLLTLLREHFSLDINIIPDSSVCIDRSLDSTLYKNTFGFQSLEWPDILENYLI